MAKFVLDNAYFAACEVGESATNFTSYVRSVTLNFTVAEQDKTVMGNSAMARLAGLQDASVDVEFVQDFASSTLDDDMWGIFARGEDVAVYVGPEGSTEATTNPVYTGTMICTAYTPIGGSVGDAAGATANFVLSVGAQMDRDITP